MGTVRRSLPRDVEQPAPPRSPDLPAHLPSPSSSTASSRAPRSIDVDRAAGSSKPKRATRVAKRPPSTERLIARERGILAERIAAGHLVALGLEILGTNVRVGRYEIDILARDGPVLVVTEVRARGADAIVRPLDTIDARKRARLRAAGKWLWRDRFARDMRFERVRFDCVAITFDAAGGRRVEHVRAAF